MALVFAISGHTSSPQLVHSFATGWQPQAKTPQPTHPPAKWTREKADATCKYPTLREVWYTTLAPTFTSRLMIEPMDGLTLSPRNAASPRSQNCLNQDR
jgi:hypothetical protein